MPPAMGEDGARKFCWNHVDARQVAYANYAPPPERNEIKPDDGDSAPASVCLPTNTVTVKLEARNVMLTNVTASIDYGNSKGLRSTNWRLGYVCV